MTFQQLYTRAADIVGIDPTTAGTDLTNLKQDINQGLRLFKNAARRYWTRQEVSTSLVENQQYYTMPPDLVRVTEVRVSSGGLTYPVEAVDSEYIWNKLNIIPAVTINIPTYYFIRGRNEIGLWPVPSSNAATGLVISYEPRLQEMVLDDITDTTSGERVAVVNGTNQLVTSGNILSADMVGRYFQVTDGSDGNWYQMSIFQSTTSFLLDNDYIGISGAGKPFIIGQAPDIPEDYHLGLVYYAAYNFFLKRKDNATSTLYLGMFNDLLSQYRENYSSKTTGVTQSMMDKYRYNIFTIPPNVIT